MMDKAQTNGNDGRSFYGNFMFSTGPNDDAGGPRDTLCHLDIPMRNCSVFLDDEPMVLAGEVIPEGPARERPLASVDRPATAWPKPQPKKSCRACSAAALRQPTSSIPSPN